VRVNDEIAERLDEIAAMLELKGENPFKVAAHRRAARALRDLPEDVRTIAADRKALVAIEGVGEKIAGKIVEYLETGAIAEREALAREIPPTLLEILKAPGVGPKTVRLLWQELGVTSVADLKRALEKGEVETLPRMGKKTVENIARALDFLERAGGRLPLGVALPLAEAIAEELRRVEGVAQAQAAGSLRRGRETIGDVDILVASRKPAAVRDAFLALPQRVETLAQGLKKCSIRAQEADPRGGLFTVQVDLRIVEPERFGAALLYFTGSKDHNVRLRERALAMGFTLNEYGLFPLRKGERGVQGDRPRTDQPVAAATEEEIYEALGLRWIPPELREDAGEFDAAERGPISLIERADIRAELHAHTTASDGALSIVELARAAKARGLRVVAVTDHSRSQPVAGGLSPEALGQHVEDVRQAQSLVKGVRILAGSEVDILADGSLDYDDKTLSLLDIVVASPHSGLAQPAEKAAARLIRAIEHPCVDVLGHPTGRLIGRREGLSPDIAAVAAAAREHRVALEVNAHWMRLDLRDAHVRLALEQGALIAVDCDVHREADFENLRYGLLTARRGWLDAGRCVNCFSERKLLEWLSRRRPNRFADASPKRARRQGGASRR